MSKATFTLSAFGDEITLDLAGQLQVLRELKVGRLELRAVDSKNVLKFSNEEARTVKRTCDEHGMVVSAIGSPIGKSPLADPIEDELGNLKRICEIAEIVGTQHVRIFSFYPPDMSSNSHYDQHVDEVIERLARLADLAQAEGVHLVLENEKAIVGDTVERCQALLVALADRPHIGLAWDPANFVQVGEDQVTERGWPLLNQYITYVHIKDAMLADGKVCPAGEGDGQLELLLGNLRDKGYQGTLALEPHLKVAGHSSGFSGPEMMGVAVAALRKLMAAQNCTETLPEWAWE